MTKTCIGLFACLSLLSTAYASANQPRQVTIAPAYAANVWFDVVSYSTDATTITGVIQNLHPQQITTDDHYQQRFVAMDGRYRVIHTLGTEVENRTEGGQTRTIQRPVQDIIRFDMAGIFSTGPSDPVDLVPLYPGHPVAKGDVWTPQAAIKIPSGTGIAHYRFHVDDIFRDNVGNTLARVSFSFTSKLTPLPDFQHSTVIATGYGWMLWDCTVQQRRKTHIHASYVTQSGSNSAREILTVDDHLTVHHGSKNF